MFAYGCWIGAAGRGVSLLALVLCGFSGCRSGAGEHGLATVAPPGGDYRDDTPEALVESYLRAWDAYDDGAVYYFRTPIDKQNASDRDAFIRDGDSKCRWHPDEWKVMRVDYKWRESRATLDLDMVSTAEDSTTRDVLRFRCRKEGGRWLVEKHAWVGDSVEVE